MALKVQAYDQHDVPIRGGVDGQRTFRNRSYKRTKKYRELVEGKTENDSLISLRAKCWKVIHDEDGVLETIPNPFFRAS